MTSAALFHEEWCPLHSGEGYRCGCFATDLYDVPADVVRVPDAAAMNRLVDTIAGTATNVYRGVGYRVVPEAGRFTFGATVTDNFGKTSVVLAVMTRPEDEQTQVITVFPTGIVTDYPAHRLS